MRYLILFLLLVTPLNAATEQLWYKMNDNAANTTVTDDGVTGNGTSSVNTSTLSVSSFVAAGLNNAFDFSAQRISTGLDISGYSNVTVTFWADFDSVSGVRQIFNNDIGAGASNEFVIDTNGSKIRSYFNLVTGGAQIAEGTTTLSTATTYHFAVVYDSTAEELRIYIDGNSTAEVTKDLSAVTITISSDQMIVAQRSGGSAQDFDGTLEDLRVYNVALTTDEIACLYNSGSGTESTLDSVCASDRRIIIS